MPIDLTDRIQQFRSAGHQLGAAPSPDDVATLFRALVMYLNHISEDEIVELNIPTGMPLVYELDADLKPIASERSRVNGGGTGGYYLGDPEKLKAAMDAVANQGKKK